MNEVCWSHSQMKRVDYEEKLSQFINKLYQNCLTGKMSSDGIHCNS